MTISEKRYFSANAEIPGQGPRAKKGRAKTPANGSAAKVHAAIAEIPSKDLFSSDAQKLNNRKIEPVDAALLGGIEVPGEDPEDDVRSPSPQSSDDRAGTIVNGEDSEDDVRILSPQPFGNSMGTIVSGEDPEDDVRSPSPQSSDDGIGTIVEGEDSEDDVQSPSLQPADENIAERIAAQLGVDLASASNDEIEPIAEIYAIVQYLRTSGFLDEIKGLASVFLAKEDTGLNRSLEIDANGECWILCNRVKQGDPLLGAGGSKKVKYALNPETLEVRARSAAKKEKSTYAAHYAKKYGAHTPGIGKSYSVLEYVNKKGTAKTSILQDVYERDLKRVDLTALSYPDALQIAVDVLEGLWNMHTSGDRHGDIKPDNIMCYEEAEGRVRAVLNDFDLSRDLLDVASTGGTRNYFAPEILYASAPQPGAFRQADIYSLGITFRELFAHQKLSPKLQEFIDAMCSSDPEFRPTAHVLFRLFQEELNKAV